MTGGGPAVVLIGSMGSGKTSVGTALADRLGVGFRDTDHDIEHRAGQSISDLFVTHGEQHFRALEVEAVRAALREHSGVLALGGGAPMQDEIAGMLAGRPVVFLDVGLAAAVRRVGLGTSRPMLLGNVRGRLRTLLEQRRPVYQALAWLTVRTDEEDVEAVAGTIAARLAVRDLPR